MFKKASHKRVFKPFIRLKFTPLEILKNFYFSPNFFYKHSHQSAFLFAKKVINII
ncbi:hypothetical protein HPHPP23_1068 [Helicobacter pylori Hp P-23]|nr:hypothetical protein HPHPP23_1068 [Helicobacter pylori Hp P-23]